MLYVIVIHPVERTEIPIIEYMLQIRFFFFSCSRFIPYNIYHYQFNRVYNKYIQHKHTKFNYF